MNDHEATPEMIRQFRREHGLRQSDLAKAIGASPQTISRWERGVQPILNPRQLFLALRGLRLRKPRRKDSA